MVVLLYVDDLIITGNDDNEVAKLQEELSIRFDMKHLGQLSHFVGLDVENMKDGIFATQKTYAEKLVQRFGIKENKKRSTPLDANLKLKHDEGALLPNPQLYRALVGSLLYLTITRPDIAFSVGLVSRFMQVPRKPHLKAARQILKYVNSTLEFGMFYEKGSKFSLIGYSDASLGGDSENGRSTSGYVFLCGGTGISWCSKKQDSVSQSTAEAEYKASSLAAQECIWLRRVVEDLLSSFSEPTIIHGDNQSALKLALNPTCHARTKHIELEHHFIREKVLEGIIGVSEVRSEDNIADILTKSLQRGPFQMLRRKLGMISRKSL